MTDNTEPTIDERLDGIIASIAGDVFDYACDSDSDRNEAVYSATQSHKRALEQLISDQVAKARIDEANLLGMVGIADANDVGDRIKQLNGRKPSDYYEQTYLPRLTQLRQELRQKIEEL